MVIHDKVYDCTSTSLQYPSNFQPASAETA
jgi:hypothetical protein